MCRDLVSTLAGVAHRHPHTAYEDLKKSLQQEWSFVQSVTSGIGVAFQAVEDELWDTFLREGKPTEKSEKDQVNGMHAGVHLGKTGS